MVKWRLVPLLFQCTFANLSEGSASVAATPLGKVVELMDVLKEHLDEDTLKDGDNYATYAEMTVKDIAASKKKISETKEKISTMTTDLEEEDAQRQQMNLDLQAAATELTKAEKELADTKSERETEHDEFVKNDAVFDESVDQLKRSLEVLGKRFKDQGQSGAVLLAVASNLQSTLEHSADFSLTTSQQDVLRDFVHIAKSQNSRQTPSFLQLRLSKQVGVYDSQSSPVVSTLENVAKKTRDNKEAAMAVEKKAVEDFKTLETQLQTQINTAKARMDTLKTNCRV